MDTPRALLHVCQQFVGSFGFLGGADTITSQGGGGGGGCKYEYGGAEPPQKKMGNVMS